MTDIPSSRGTGARIAKAKRQTSTKVDEFDDLKARNASKEKEVEQLLEESRRLKKENEELKKNSESLSLYKTQNEELKSRLDSYKQRLEEAEGGRKLRSLSLNNIADDGSGDKPLGIQEEYLNLDWSYGELEPPNITDMTLRTGLLEKIYDMARRSDAFRVQLVDNLIVLLKFKELTVDDPSDKKSLQVSIDNFTDTRNELQHNLELGFDDLEERVAQCFAGIEEFHAFRNHFKEELEEIKRSLEKSASVVESPTKAAFSPMKTSSPMRSAPQKISMKALTTGLSKSHNSSRVHFDRRSSIRLSEKSFSSPDGSCKDCQRYLALLRSFRTTQEADQQKFKEQARTIEKLSTALTSANRPVHQSAKLGPELMDSCTQKFDNELDFTSRRLRFESPLTGSSAHKTEKERRLASGDRGTTKTTVLTTTGTITERSVLVEKTAQTLAKETMSAFVQTSFGGSSEKDLRVDHIFYQNKISALEQEVWKLRNKEKSTGEIQKPETPVNSKSDFSLDVQLKEKTRELQNAQMHHRMLEKRIDEVGRDFEEAISLLDQKNIDFESEKLTNLTLREDVQRLRIELNEVANGTHNTSVGAFHTSTPIPVAESPAVDPKIRQDYERLLKAYQQLEYDFRDAAVMAEELLKEKGKLEKMVNLQSQKPSSSPKLTSMQKTIDDLKNSQKTLREKHDEVMRERNRLKDELGRHVSELSSSKMQLNSTRQEVGASQESARSEVTKLKAEIQTLQKRLEVAEREKLTLSAKKEHKNQRDLAEVRDRDLVIEDLRSEIDELHRQIDSSETKIDLLKHETRDLQKAGEEVAKECFLVTGEKLAVEKKVKDMSERLEKCNKELTLLKTDLSCKDKQVNLLERNYKNMENKFKSIAEQSWLDKLLGKTHLSPKKTKVRRSQTMANIYDHHDRSELHQKQVEILDETKEVTHIHKEI